MPHEVFMNYVHPSSLLQQLSDLWRMDQLCDAVVTVDKVIIAKAHRLLLFAISPKLKMDSTNSSFHSAVLDVSLPSGVSHRAAHAFLRYIYEGFLFLTDSIVQDLIKIAESLEIKCLYQCCKEFSLKMANTCTANSSCDIEKWEGKGNDYCHIRKTDNLKFETPETGKRKLLSDTVSDAKNARLDSEGLEKRDENRQRKVPNSRPVDNVRRISGSEFLKSPNTNTMRHDSPTIRDSESTDSRLDSRMHADILRGIKVERSDQQNNDDDGAAYSETTFDMSQEQLDEMNDSTNPDMGSPISQISSQSKYPHQRNIKSEPIVEDDDDEDIVFTGSSGVSFMAANSELNDEQMAILQQGEPQLNDYQFESVNSQGLNVRSSPWKHGQQHSNQMQQPADLGAQREVSDGNYSQQASENKCAVYGVGSTKRIMMFPSTGDSESGDSEVSYRIIRNASARGKDKLFDSAGFCYNLQHVSPSRNMTVWRCNKRSKSCMCKATVQQIADSNKFIPGNVGHSCVKWS